MNPQEDSGKLTDELVARFERSPICTVSLSSKELFHSNFLAWILKTKGGDALAGELFGDSEMKIGEVEREKKNYDLDIEVTHGRSSRIVVENKVKSIPSIEQLDGYYEELKKDHVKRKRDSGFRLILLSFIEPTADLIVKLKDKVEFISYRHLLNCLKGFTPEGAYEQAIVEDYGFLLEVLLVVTNMANLADPNAQLAFDEAAKKRLTKIRLFDIAQKIRFSHLEIECTKHLKDTEKLTDFKRRPAEVGMSRAQALLSYKWEINDQFVLGIQIQGGHFRRFVESLDKSNVEQLAKELAKESLWIFGEYPKAPDEFGKFGKVFKYRYSRTPETRSGIIELLTAASQHLQANADKIRQVVERLSSSSV